MGKPERKFEEFIGTSIIAGAVMMKHRMPLVEEDHDRENPVFFYGEKDSNHGGWVKSMETGDDLLEQRNSYLYGGATYDLNFDFWKYGGLSQAEIMLYHPMQSRIKEEVMALDRELREIKFPYELYSKLEMFQISTEQDFHPEMNVWAERFVRDYGSLFKKENKYLV